MISKWALTRFVLIVSLSAISVSALAAEAARDWREVDQLAFEKYLEASDKARGDLTIPQRWNVYKEAVELQEKAVSLAELQAGESSQEYLRAVKKLGFMAQQAGRVETVRMAATRVLSPGIKINSADPSFVAAQYLDLGTYLWLRENGVDQAITSRDTALANALNVKARHYLELDAAPKSLKQAKAWTQYTKNAAYASGDRWNYSDLSDASARAFNAWMGQSSLSNEDIDNAYAVSEIRSVLFKSSGEFDLEARARLDMVDIAARGPPGQNSYLKAKISLSKLVERAQEVGRYDVAVSTLEKSIQFERLNQGPNAEIGDLRDQLGAAEHRLYASRAAAQGVDGSSGASRVTVQSSTSGGEAGPVRNSSESRSASAEAEGGILKGAAQLLATMAAIQNPEQADLARGVMDVLGLGEYGPSQESIELGRQMARVRSAPQATVSRQSGPPPASGRAVTSVASSERPQVDSAVSRQSSAPPASSRTVGTASSSERAHVNSDGWNYDPDDNTGCVGMESVPFNGKPGPMQVGYYRISNRCSYPVYVSYCAAFDRYDGSPAPDFEAFREGSRCPGIGLLGLSLGPGASKKESTWYLYRNARWSAFVCKQDYSPVGVDGKYVSVIGQEYYCRKLK